MLRDPCGPAGSASAAPPPPADASASEALKPRVVEQLLRLQSDLRLGLPVILLDGAAATLIALVETLTEARYRAITALGAAELALTRRRAEALGIELPKPSDTWCFRVPEAADSAWLAAVAGRDAQASGAAAPDRLPALHAGSSVHGAAIALARTAQALPAVLAVPLTAATAPAGLLAMPVDTALQALERARAHEPVSSARLPTDASEAGRVHVFRPDGGGAEHYAVEIGAPDFTQPVLVRLHSACFTGDVLGSRKCDCGSQLRAAMAAMAARGGVLLYLDQEGRGIGLANKLRAYALQDAGLDTVEANHWLGFEDDQRDFRIGAQLLHRLGIGRVRLLTNNPAKLETLAGHGIEVVERVPLAAGRTAWNARYLATKAAKSGHLL